MRSHWTLAVFVLGLLAAVQAYRTVRAQGPMVPPANVAAPPSPSTGTIPPSGIPGTVVPAGGPAAPAGPPPQAPLTDMQLTEKIYAAITQPVPSPTGNPADAAPGLVIANLRVEVQDRRVVLSGTARNMKDRIDAAVRAVTAASGLIVTNKITVR